LGDDVYFYELIAFFLEDIQGGNWWTLISPLAILEFISRFEKQFREHLI